uniref:G-protein coupled receptors family 2 profile 2 domain-containing protein n=1 Tax=Clastoptera arizonana TaxID=38151 RepID=A0A1B6CNV6_9HEMI
MMSTLSLLVYVCSISLVLGQDESSYIVPKCCAIGETLVEQGESCIRSNLTFEPEFWSSENQNSIIPPEEIQTIDLIIGDPCLYGKYRLEPELDSGDEYHILQNGSLLLPFLQPGLLGTTEYCLESFNHSGTTMVMPLVCFPPPPPPLTFWQSVVLIVYPIGLIISIPFLVMTFVVFAFIPELRDAHGKSLSCHVFCLIIAYLSLAFVQIEGHDLPNAICITLAFVIQFSFMSCFFWLNVMCVDTWWRLTSGICTTRNLENRRFVWYSVYAWICPALIVIVTMIMDFSPTVPAAYLKPNFGLQSCWFHSDNAALPYFYGPVGLLLIFNTTLFLLCINALRNDLELVYQEDAYTLQNSELTCSTASRRVEMFKQCLILFIVMGLNWTLELASFLIKGPPQIWLLTDIINSLQGVIIFLVFVVRIRRVRLLATERLLPCFKNVHPQGRSRPKV